MRTVQIPDALFNTVQTLAAQRALSVDEIITEFVETSLKDQVNQQANPEIAPFDLDFDTAYHVAKSTINAYHSLLLGRIFEEQDKPNPDQEIIRQLEAEEEKHKEAGWRLLSMTTDELQALIHKYADLANKFRASHVR